ncbi:permease prefix domain 1-containing protein [Luedemannella helvata]|uniref:Permease prefix domain 1-containing protein n=1 Tax=Luedemannella helvata TaxID=349315 RepID=A0ABP4WER2_9ACTN
MTAPTPSLTERYVEATLRRLPERQRADIERELRASIDDAVEARVEAGEDPAEAERAVLTGLGDPARLAAGYADRPLHLIGPDLFLPYTRLLTALIAIVVPIVATIAGIARAVDGDVGQVIGDIITAAITTGVNVAFWTTLLFAILERLPSVRASVIRDWTLDQLPEPPKRRRRHADLIAETVMMVLFAAFVLLTPVLRFKTDASGGPIGVLSPWLWDTGVVYLFLVLALVGLSFNYVKLHVRWSAPLAVAGAVVNLAASGVLLWVARTDRLINPAFRAAVDWPAEVWEWLPVGVTIGVAISAVMVVVELVRGFITRSWERADFGETIREATQRIPGVK